MRAVALGDDGRLEVVDKADPVAGPDEVVVAVERCGICGSDLHLKASGLLPRGAVLGHELSGTVVEVGEQVAGRPALGQRVSVLPARRCGACDRCRAGEGHLCPAQALTAIGLGANDGGYAERVRVPARSCHPLPDPVTAEAGALVEPYAVGLHAVGRSRAAGNPDVSVGVIGAGPIGLMCLAALRRFGVERMTVAEPRPRRAAVAEALGAEVVGDAARLAPAAGGPLDVVFDAAGGLDTPSLALQAARPGGQVVLVGAPAIGSDVPMPGLLWVVKEVDFAPAIAYTDEEFAAAAACVTAGAVDSDLVVSDVRPLDAAQRSFEELSGADAPAKVMLAPS